MRTTHRARHSALCSASPAGNRSRHLLDLVTRLQGPAPSKQAAKNVSVNAATVDRPVAEASELISKRGQRRRTVAVAVDGTEQCQAGLKWLVSEVFRAGDEVHLVSVVNNDRCQPLAVGAARNGQITASLDEEFDFSKQEEYGDRLVHDRMTMLADMFQPIVQNAGFPVLCSVNTVPGHPSAANIAQSLVSSANEFEADMLVVTSHGGGLKCSYGSVARYCVQHFKRAILVLPARMKDHADAASPSVSVGINHTQEVQDAISWSADHLFHAGDKVNVLHSEETSIDTRNTTDQYAIMAGVREQTARHNIKELSYVKTSPKAGEVADRTAEQLNKLCARSLLKKAAEKNTRALVMVNYASQDYMQEMMYGSLAMFVSRESPLPLALVPRGYANE